jgi:ubiquitin-conjugating enzyme E2 variant
MGEYPTNPWLFGRFDYPLSHRVLEVVSLGVCSVVSALLTWQVGAEVAERFSPVVLAAVVIAVVLAYAVADLVSGLVHFALDTFGSPDTKLIGQKFVKPFRDHHADPLLMTHGDFIAVNADNFFVCLPVLVPVFLLVDMRNHPYAGSFLVALAGAVIMTNQIHKWCHMQEVPALVTRLQQRGVVLSPDRHNVHHTAPFNSNHCITWGRMNRLLNVVTVRWSKRVLQGA